MTKKYLFEELRACKRIALSCPTCESALISIHEAYGMIKLAYTYDIINDRQYHTLCRLNRKFMMYLLDSKPLKQII